MPRFLPILRRRRAAYRGSAMLHSATARAARLLPVLLGLWLLTGWALDWWP